MLRSQCSAGSRILFEPRIPPQKGAHRAGILSRVIVLSVRLVEPTC
jgi:hypothetical protein